MAYCHPSLNASAAYPDIELELHEMSILDQHQALMRGVIDVGLLRPQPTPPEL